MFVVKNGDVKPVPPEYEIKFNIGLFGFVILSTTQPLTGDILNVVPLIGVVNVIPL